MFDLTRKFPIGIQTFEKIRRGNYLYVDKTELVWKLAYTETPYFFSRPRRFGKSLLLSTFESYFLGKKELFEGLAILDGVEASASAFFEYKVDANNPIPLIYHSGYLTIKDYDRRFNNYLLDFPNDEVRFGFINFLVPLLGK